MATVNDSFGYGDSATMGYYACQHLEGSYEADRQAAWEEWQKAVDAWEDGVSDVDPGAFEDWF